MQDASAITVHESGSEAEARQYAGWLAEAGVPAQVRPVSMRATRGFGTQFHSYRVAVHRLYAVAAARVIAEHMQLGDACLEIAGVPNASALHAGLQFAAWMLVWLTITAGAVFGLLLLAR